MASRRARLVNWRWLPARYCGPPTTTSTPVAAFCPGMLKTPYSASPWQAKVSAVSLIMAAPQAQRGLEERRCGGDFLRGPERRAGQCREAHIETAPVLVQARAGRRRLRRLGGDQIEPVDAAAWARG